MLDCLFFEFLLPDFGEYSIIYIYSLNANFRCPSAIEKSVSIDVERKAGDSLTVSLLKLSKL